MTNEHDEPKDSRSLTALTGLYRDSIDGPTADDLDHGLDALMARVAGQKPGRHQLVRWSLLGATALAAVIIWQTTSVRRRHATESPLTYRVDGGSVIEGGYLRAFGQAGMDVVFNEGSRFALDPGARGRIRAVDKAGAHLSVEHGTASFQVTQRAERRWLVDVGPFLVTVKGTVFTVSWDPLSEQFELRLRRGSVVVSGPVSAGEIGLRAGQRLVVNLAKVETMITEETPASAPGLGSTPAVPAMPSGQRADQPSSATAATASARSTVTKLDGDRRWTAELARGHWDRILADVRRLGVDATLSKASSEELFALADAARYRRRPGLARAALLAERKRFPGTARSLDAIYLLGRVEESREGGTAQAIAWYDEYLAEAPAGPMVGEALGRKMTLTEKLDGPARARPIAEDYLRRFPSGNYAGSARELLRGP